MAPSRLSLNDDFCIAISNVVLKIILMLANNKAFKCYADETEDETPFQQAIDFDARVQQPAEEWCTCGGCETMEAPVMNFCCQELEELQGRLFADDLDCIKQHREFPVVVLEEAVLRTALVAMKDVKKTSFREPIGERSVITLAYTVYVQ